MTRPTATPDVPPTSPAPAATAGSAGLPSIPDDVRKFAEQVGAAPYLAAVTAMTRRIFPQGDLAVLLLEDAEIEDYLHVAFEADVTGWTVEQVVSAMRSWSNAIADHCPATHTPYFTLLRRARR
jgi:hypothetical protein